MCIKYILITDTTKCSLLTNLIKIYTIKLRMYQLIMFNVAVNVINESFHDYLINT